MKYGFGVDLGGTTVKIAYFDETGKMLSKWEIPTRRENGGEKIIPDIADSVNRYRKENNIPDEVLLGVGIGVPGAVVKGVVNRCVNLGWGVVPIEEELSKGTGLSVKASNDANVAALGEYWVGGGQGSENVIRARMDELRKKRVEKQPLEYPSAGSTFKRPEGYFAGKLIEDAGLRGFRVGDAQVSEKHCGFVINRGEATAAQILELMQRVQERVKENSGVDLEPEVRLLGF